ncbi:hypothetical protein [Lysobacter sp. HA35]
MERTERRDRLVALVLAALAQLAFVVMLLRLVPMANVRATKDDALVVEYLPRKERVPIAREVASDEIASFVTARHRHAAQVTVEFDARRVPAARDSEKGATVAAPLDLRVPEPPPVTDHFATREKLRAPPIDARRTRFADSWQGGGTLLDEARARSGVVRIATSLFGGPPRHCSEVERRLRKPNCLPEPEDAPIHP